MCDTVINDGKKQAEQDFFSAVCMINNAEHIQCDNFLVALSGGADSTCLLRLTEAYVRRSPDKRRVRAVHINHCLRGEESDRDERFCRDLCESLQITLIVCRVDVKSYANEKKLSIETAARELRYKAFEETAEENEYIVTAHTASDNAETILFNMARGTSMTGIAGIPLKRGRFIRPLLGFSRADVLNYLDYIGQTYVTDSTNLVPDGCSRNRIRMQVMPVLKQINDSAEENICALSKIAREENDFLDSLAYEALKSGKSLAPLHPAVRKRAYARLLRDNNIPVTGKLVDMLDGAVNYGYNRKINVMRDTFVIIADGIVKVTETASERMAQTVCEPVRMGGNEFYMGKTVILEKFSKDCDADERFVNTLLTNNLMDYGRIQGTAVLRSRRGGDKIKLSQRSCTKTLKNLFNGRVDAEEREKVAVIADDNGVIWLEGFGTAQRVKPDSESKSENIVAVSVMRADNTDTFKE